MQPIVSVLFSNILQIENLRRLTQEDLYQILGQQDKLIIIFPNGYYLKLQKLSLNFCREKKPLKIPTMMIT
jgi:hypothetical protein